MTSEKMTFEEEIASINRAYFFREFTYSNTTFSPPLQSEVELADSLIWIEDELVIFQLKERENQEDTTEEQEARWFERKVLGKATKQVRDTLKYIDEHDNITLENHRSHQFTVESSVISNIHKLVVFRPDPALSDSLVNKKYHESRTAGIIHMIPADDYVGIIQTLITPAEVMDYLSYRKSLITRWGEHLNSLPEQALVGHYIGGEKNERPELTHTRYLEEINENVAEWDITGIMHLYADRITDAGEQPTDYYKIVVNLARLSRNDLKFFKERYGLSKEKAMANEFVQPYRFACPELDIGFVFIPLTSEHIPNQRNALTNLTTAHKYDQRLTRCIGMTFSKYDQEQYDVGWCLMDEPWQYDEEIESFLNESYPFREVRTVRVSRY